MARERENFITGYHRIFVSDKADLKKSARILALAENCRQAVSANGNVNLQLTNFIVSL